MNPVVNTRYGKVRGSAADTLFVMYGGLPDGAIC